MKRRSWIATGVSVVAVAAIVGGVYAATSAVQRPAEESPTIAPIAQTTTPTPTTTPSPTPTPTPEPVTEVVVPAPEAPGEQAPVEEQKVEEPAPPPPPPAPVRCPAGSSANSSDGVNDTSCFPDICFNIPVPDPAHPECDVAFKP